jgi:hypothetical protein
MGGYVSASASAYKAVKRFLNNSLRNNNSRMSTKGRVEKRSMGLVTLIMNPEDNFSMYAPSNLQYLVLHSLVT